MKWLGYILSLYMLLLAVFPCCLVDDCPDDKTKTEQLAGHENGDEDCGNCSPFFNCEGCAAVSMTIETVYFDMTSLPVKQVYTGFLTSVIPDVHYDFWQPPKLG
ncbi:DUF6660 family protein [Terrimonas alba]|uniref:DUF6660 family protein n=1 Tax=Terrimonas alba TaxID=3349636 RepID=UPI0035F4CBC3